MTSRDDDPITRTDHLRFAPTLAERTPGFKEWTYFCVSTPDVDLLLTLTFLDRLDQPPLHRGARGARGRAGAHPRRPLDGRRRRGAAECRARHAWTRRRRDGRVRPALHHRRLRPQRAHGFRAARGAPAAASARAAGGRHQRAHGRRRADALDRRAAARGTRRGDPRRPAHRDPRGTGVPRPQLGRVLLGRRLRLGMGPGPGTAAPGPVDHRLLAHLGSRAPARGLAGDPGLARRRLLPCLPRRRDHRRGVRAAARRRRAARAARDVAGRAGDDRRRAAHARRARGERRRSARDAPRGCSTSPRSRCRTKPWIWGRRCSARCVATRRSKASSAASASRSLHRRSSS